MALKGYADELNKISIPAYVRTKFITQDLINKGRYYTFFGKGIPIRFDLRMLTRVSGASTFTSHVLKIQRVAAIYLLHNTYPVVVTANSENIEVSVFDV